ncbi:hypothetical protein BH18ACI5_BH18ACI5_04420 [soil metagenome]
MSDRAAALAMILNKPLVWERSSLDATLAALNASAALPLKAAAKRSRDAAPGIVGVLPIVGPITYRPSIFSFLFGGTAITEARDTLKRFVQNRDVETIVMLVDSGGGDVIGVEEFSYELRQARRVKPIVACVDCVCGSAAYWLAAQATEIVATPSGQVGSVGCYYLHADQSQLLANVGIRPTFIHAGRFKVEGTRTNRFQTRHYDTFSTTLTRCTRRLWRTSFRGAAAG